MAENITLNHVSTFQNDSSAVATVNSNMDAITTAFTDVLSRTGVSPNTMQTNLDMNNNTILNLPTPVNPTDPVRLEDLTGLNIVPTGSLQLPNSTTVGHVATWGNTTGTKLQDGGSVATVTSPVTDGVVYQGASTLNTTAAGTNGQLLVGNTGAAPSWNTAGATGQVLMGATGAAPNWSATGTTGQFLGANTGTNPTFQSVPGVISGANTSGNIAVANGTNFASATPSGDISSISTGGAVTLSSAVLKNNVTNTISKGYTITANNIGTVSSGTTTPDPTLGNYQFYTNNGAHTLAAPASDCAIDILITNGASAGAITFSGFTVGANTGDALTTTNTNKFILSIRRINAIATYVIKALQ